MEQNGTITCARCKNEKSCEEFPKNKRSKNGYFIWCKLCKNGRDKERRLANQEIFNAKRREKSKTLAAKELKKKNAALYYKKHRQTVIDSQATRRAKGIAIINQYKNVPCADCHKLYQIECMELDHVRGIKKANVASLTNRDQNTILEELAKCEVVCMVCHRIRTLNRIGRTKQKRILQRHKMINEIKSCPCMDCGITYPPIGMDFDHVRGIKLREISNMTKFPKSKVLEEIKKCDIVCAFCHRARTLVRLKSRHFN